MSRVLDQTPPCHLFSTFARCCHFVLVVNRRLRRRRSKLEPPVFGTGTGIVEPLHGPNCHYGLKVRLRRPKRIARRFKCLRQYT
jgi:hypothetical protein